MDDNYSTTAFGSLRAYPSKLVSMNLLPSNACSVTILDAAGIEALPPPLADEERRARRWVAALAHHGPGHFIDNADVTARGLNINGKVLPLVLAHGASGNTDVCSAYSHYIGYTLEEFTKRHRRVPLILPQTLMLPLTTVLQAWSIDRIAFVNNWLFATNPSHGLSSDEIEAVTAHLVTACPDAAIVFRSLNPYLDPDGIEQMLKIGYRFVRSRRVYLVDARTTRYLRHTNARIDRRLLERTPYQIVDDLDLLVPHAARLAKLYRGLYLYKHSQLNPQLNERFFALTLTERILTYRGLVRNGRVDGFVAFFEGEDVLIGAILGYDLEVPARAGLYRMLFALLLAEGAKRRRFVNLSAGADHFKVLRGGAPVEECDAVFDRHLPLRRRLAWSSLRGATKLWARARRAPAAGAPRELTQVDWDLAWKRIWRPHTENPWFPYQAETSDVLR